ncbi:MAG TPA: hypothetical protein VF349_03520 [Candidatus Limnocylindrales bacterium]
MSVGVGEAHGSSARRRNPYLALRREIRGRGTLENRLLFAAAVAGPVLFLSIGLLAGMHGAAVALLVLLPTPALGVAIGLRRRAVWPALDVISWLDRQAAAEWRREVGGSAPRNASGARAWLESHPAGSAPKWAIATALVLAGRIPAARQAISATPLDTPGARRRRLELELVADAGEGLPIDTTTVEAAIREDPGLAPDDVAARLAYHRALAEIDRGGDGLTPLLAARASLGRLPSDLAWRLWLVRFQYAAVSFTVGAWLLVTVLVGLATSGGAVWF